jgi:hypothetical protein
MWAWPRCVLTDYERKFVRLYKTGKYPGVLKRVYTARLNDTANVDQNLPTIQLSDQIQIARRSRVFGLTFSGNIDSWRLRITNASGTLYTVPSRRTQTDPLVSSMVPSSISNALSLGGVVPPITPGVDFSPGIGPYPVTSPFALGNAQAAPLLIDPNWLLLPNETLIFNGTPLPVAYDINQEQEAQPLVLTIGIHVWEFPVMGNASAIEREIM